MAAKVTFLPTATPWKLIQVTLAPSVDPDTGDLVVDLDTKIDLYSDGKEDWLADPVLRKHTFPIQAIGGNPRPGGKLGTSYFLDNRWKIAPYEGSHTFRIAGNLYRVDGAAPVLDTVGAYTVRVERDLSALVEVETLESGAGAEDWSSAERAQIRHRLGVDGSASEPTAAPSLARPGDAMTLTAGERTAVAVQVNATLEAGRLDAAISSRAAPGAAMTLTAGERTAVVSAILGGNLPTGWTLADTLDRARIILNNRSEATPGAPGTLTFYADDDVTPAFTMNISDYQGGPVTGAAGVPARRTRGT